MIRFCFLLTFWMGFQSFVLGQNTFGFAYDPSIPVRVGSTPLQLPWMGGINYGQFSNLDINYDGIDDLIAFDRSCDRFVPFLAVSTPSLHFEYDYSSVWKFPRDCKYRAAFIDYNQDGKNDLFTYGVGGIKVYKNTGSSATGLQWEVAKEVVFSNVYGTLTNLYVSGGDIPAYVDIEGDGDIDVLTFHIGGERLEYHKNLSMETYGIPDSLVFELKNECWGQFREDANNNAIVLNDNQSPCGTGNLPNPELGQTDEWRDERHTGSAVLAIDMNGNGVKDLLIGDVAYPNLVLLMNGGTAPNTNSAMISQDPTFPSNSTVVDVNLFPAAYSADVDFDGKKDLLVAPNAKTVSENVSSVLYYKNTGTNTNQLFAYQTHSFLQEESIEAGYGSVPIMVDFDGDGLRDLIVANFFRYKPVLNKESNLLAYRNVGTAANPVYQLYSNDLFGFTSLGMGLRNIPTFGDLDNDGDLDMVTGRESGLLSFLQNVAGAGNPMSFTAPQILNDQNGSPINVAAYSAPQLVDLNEDGKLDLVIGKKTGELVYYQNTGSVSAPIFTLVDTDLGEVDVASTPDGYAVPHFFKVNNEWKLFVGAFDGMLHFYENIESNLHPDSSFTLRSNHFLDLDMSQFSAFWVEDIDQDGALNMFVGQDLGGLYHFEADLDSNIGLQEDQDENAISFELVPNPAKNNVQIIGFSATEELNVRVYNELGMLIHEGNEQQFQVENWSPGVYLVQATVKGQTRVKRLLVW